MLETPSLQIFSKAVAVFESDFWSSDCNNELMLAINQVGANIDTRGAGWPFGGEVGGWGMVGMAWTPFKAWTEGWKARRTDVSDVGESSSSNVGLFGFMVQGVL